MFQSSLLLSKYCQGDSSERVSVSSTAFSSRSARSDLDFSQGRHFYRQVFTLDFSGMHKYLSLRDNYCGKKNSMRPIHVHLYRSLMADHRLESERIEALKLVRCFVTTKEGMQHVSDSVLRAVIAVAEQTDEKLRNACLETLGEMSMN